MAEGGLLCIGGVVATRAGHVCVPTDSSAGGCLGLVSDLIVAKGSLQNHTANCTDLSALTGSLIAGGVSSCRSKLLRANGTNNVLGASLNTAGGMAQSRSLVIHIGISGIRAEFARVRGISLLGTSRHCDNRLIIVALGRDNRVSSFNLLSAVEISKERLAAEAIIMLDVTCFDTGGCFFGNQGGVMYVVQLMSQNTPTYRTDLSLVFSSGAIGSMVAITARIATLDNSTLLPMLRAGASPLQGML